MSLAQPFACAWPPAQSPVRDLLAPAISWSPHQHHRNPGLCVSKPERPDVTGCILNFKCFPKGGPCMHIQKGIYDYD